MPLRLHARMSDLAVPAGRLVSNTHTGARARNEQWLASRKSKCTSLWLDLIPGKIPGTLEGIEWETSVNGKCPKAL